MELSSFHAIKNLFFLLRGSIGAQRDRNRVLELSSEENPCDTPLYWLVNRDAYNGLL